MSSPSAFAYFACSALARAMFSSPIFGAVRNAEKDLSAAAVCSRTCCTILVVLRAAADHARPGAGEVDARIHQMLRGLV